MQTLCYRIFCAMGSKFMTAEQSTFMIDLHQVGMMLRYTLERFLGFQGAYMYKNTLLIHFFFSLINIISLQACYLSIIMLVR